MINGLRPRKSSYPKRRDRSVTLEKGPRNIVAIFHNTQQRLNAETTLRDGARKGSFSASGWMLMIDRLDQIISILTKINNKVVDR
jgi:hypothetical protein